MNSNREREWVSLSNQTPKRMEFRVTQTPSLRPMILLDWLAELESNFLGHIIVIIWPINNVYTIAT